MTISETNLTVPRETNARLFRWQHRYSNQASAPPRLLSLFNVTTKHSAVTSNSTVDSSWNPNKVVMANSTPTPTSLASLITCIKEGDMRQLVDELDMREWNVNQAINDRYALHFAAEYGQAEVLCHLLERGANPNVRDFDGVTPLLAAIYEGRTRCVELLLAHGADLKGRTPDGKSYTDAADQDDIKQLLLNATHN